jgi:hypothetical protein
MFILSTGFTEIHKNMFKHCFLSIKSSRAQPRHTYKKPTFRGPSRSSSLGMCYDTGADGASYIYSTPGHSLYHIPVDEDWDGTRNVGFYYIPDAADCPRRLYWILSPRKLQIIHCFLILYCFNHPHLVPRSIMSTSYTCSPAKCFYGM